jgi:hypothetical protein
LTRARETRDYNEILTSSFVPTLYGHINDFVRIVRAEAVFTSHTL